MRVFMTGATGLLAGSIAERLRSLGHDVKALVRPGADVSHLLSIGAEVAEGSFTDPATCAKHLAGCAALVHSAALMAPQAPWEQYRQVNVEGTRTVLEAAAKAGLARALYVSSVAVYGSPAQLAGGRIDETAPTDAPLAPGSFYARSKREAEALTWDYSRSGRLPVSVVRPCFVYGERDRMVVPHLVRLARSRFGFTVGSGHNHLALVYGGNVAEGAVLALTHEGAAGRVYNLANDFPITQREILARAAETLGRRRPLVPLPRSLATGGAWAIASMARISGARRAPSIGARGLAFLSLDNPFISDRARAELGWEPSTPHDEALRRSIRWFLDHETGG